MRRFHASLLLFSSCFASGVHAQTKTVLPDEIQAVGGAGPAQAGAGAAALSDSAAIHLNPAMLYRHRSYNVSGGYFWPVEGRPFYKLSVLDGVTSKWTAGFEYTGFQEELENRTQREWDSPVRKRGSIAFAIPTDRLAIGFSGHYVEAEDPSSVEAKTIKAFTLGGGIAAQITPGVRMGVSMENLNNKKVAEVSPQIFRAGVAWEDRTGSIVLSADYRERQRSKYLEGLPIEEGATAALADFDVEPEDLEKEKMAFVGAQLHTLDVIRIFVAGGKNVDGDRAERVSGGLGIYQKNFSLAYAISRDYPEQKDLQGSLHLSIVMQL